LGLAGCSGSTNNKGSTTATSATRAAGTAISGTAAAAATTRATATAVTTAPKRGGTLATFLNDASSEDFEPQALRSNSSDTQPILAHIYNGLLRYRIGRQGATTDLTLEGALAQKWEQPDPQTLTFQLRPGVKFHDKPPVNGRTLTAEDVKFTFERLLASPFSYLNFFDTISTVQTPASDTVVFKLKQPDAALLTHLGVGYAWILAKEAGKQSDKGVQGSSYADITSAIGTGAFIADSYEHGVRFVGKRNPAYFEQGMPYLDQIEIQVIADIQTQLAALRAGKVQVGAIPGGSLGDLRATNGALTYDQDYTQNYYSTAMRTDKPPFNDVRVRRAMAMAWDQKNIAKLEEAPDAPPTFGSVPAQLGDAYLPADKLGENAKWWELNLQDAKQLLSASGYADGFAADYNGSVANQPLDYPEVFAANMAKIGIKVGLKIGEHAAFQATTLIGNYEGFAGYVIYLLDSDDFFSTLLPGARRNLSHVNDPHLTDLEAKQRAELDTTKRLAITHDLVQYLAGQVYVLPKPQIVTTWASQPVLKNFKPRFGYQPVFNVVWLDK